MLRVGDILDASDKTGGEDQYKPLRNVKSLCIEQCMMLKTEKH